MEDELCEAMTNGQITVEKHLIEIFKEFKERYLSDQKSSDEKFENFKFQLDKEGKLLAEKYKSDLQAYPNIEDFNKLQDKVTVEVSSAVGKAKALPLVISIVAVLISAIVGVTVIYK